MSDTGYIALYLALVTSLYSAFTFILGTGKKRPEIIDSARNGLIAVFGLVSISVIILSYSLVTHNFQIEYVANYTSRDLPLPYLISALWAGNDGSLLFWEWLLSAFALIAILQKRAIGKELVPYAGTVIMVTQAFFLVVLLSVSNPFHTVFPVPDEGTGLNPILENPGMVLHPPALLAGYAGLTIPFAFAIAALWAKRLDDEWIGVVRRWTLLTWLLLGVGNIIGAWWAYVELGWGGYWAWDPVENAGLMPWLVVTAFLHSTMMQRRRGMLKVWNMLLVIITFILALFGTFLTRSGIIASVHTFSESSLGPLFISFIAISLSGSLGLLYYRRGVLKSDSEMETLVSRESTFLLNNFLFVGLTFAILVGTMFPTLSEAVLGVKIGLGPSFFNLLSGPVFLSIIFLAGMCTLIGWRKVSMKNMVRSFVWPLAASLVLGAALFLSGVREWYALVAFAVCVFTFAAMFYDWLGAIKARSRLKARSFIKVFIALIMANKPRYGGYIVHVAIILIAIGVTGSSLYNVEKEAVLVPGESMSINNYTLTYDNMEHYQTQTKTVIAATISVYNRGKFVGKVIPEKYFHYSYGQPVTEVAIRSTLAEDLYVILLGGEKDGTAAFKVLVNPLVNWIWIGGGVLVLGGLIAFWPERQGVPASGQVKKNG